MTRPSFQVFFSSTRATSRVSSSPCSSDVSLRSPCEACFRDHAKELIHVAVLSFRTPLSPVSFDVKNTTPPLRAPFSLTLPVPPSPRSPGQSFPRTSLSRVSWPMQIWRGERYPFSWECSYPNEALRRSHSPTMILLSLYGPP